MTPKVKKKIVHVLARDERTVKFFSPSPVLTR